MVLRAADLDSVQIVRRGLACLSIGDNVESDLLSLVEDTHASAFDRADVHEDIFAAIVWLDKAEALLVIEELHGSFCHIASFRYVCNEAARSAQPICSRFGEKSSVQTRDARRGQVVRPKLDSAYMAIFMLDCKVTRQAC